MPMSTSYTRTSVLGKEEKKRKEIVSTAKILFESFLSTLLAINMKTLSVASCHVTQAVERKRKVPPTALSSRLKSALNEAIDKGPFFFSASLHSSHWKRFPDSPSQPVGSAALTRFQPGPL